MNYDVKLVVEDIKKYIKSREGQRELAEAMKRAEETSAKMREASRVRIEDLLVPMDI